MLISCFHIPPAADKCAPLEGWHTQQVACGVGFTLFLVQPDEAKLAALPVR